MSLSSSSKLSECSAYLLAKGKIRKKHAYQRDLLAQGLGVKLICIVPADLHMSVGKTVAQVVHGAIGCYRKALPVTPTSEVKRWLENGECTVVLSCENNEELMMYLKDCMLLGLNYHLVTDEGRTEVPPNSNTVLAVGPHYGLITEKIFGHLETLQMHTGTSFENMQKHLALQKPTHTNTVTIKPDANPDGEENTTENTNDEVKLNSLVHTSTVGLANRMLKPRAVEGNTTAQASSFPGTQEGNAIRKVKNESSPVALSDKSEQNFLAENLTF